MKIIVNKFIPFTGFMAINLFGILFVKNLKRLTESFINHESIHSAQLIEVTIAALIIIGIAVVFGISPYFLLLVPFSYYIIYVLEWLIRLFINKDAYKSIYFEQEAYKYQNDLSYLKSRKRFAMWRL